MGADWQVGYAITHLPEDLHPHRQVKKVYEQRREMIDSGEGVDWGFAEALAFGTLLSEGENAFLKLCAMCKMSLSLCKCLAVIAPV